MGPFGPGPTLPERPNLSLPGTESPFGAKGAGIDFGRNDPLGAKGTKPEGTTPGPNSPKTGDSGAKPGEGEKPTKEKPLDEKTPAEKPANSSKDADARPAESTTEKSVESKP
jgi:hypothetical protein